ncbi:MAG: 3-phosphoshikimate 1-carboxyvinyltransferase, partial [Chloroflexota bacterium]|nr:3-phosphoshikimate 1-carboxyvinyltransferase [Chloroflexota bacterium]
MSQRLTVHSRGPLRGCVRVPGDKSISHRALLLGALAGGASRVSGFLPAGDCLATLSCLRALGVEIIPIPGPSPYEGEGSPTTLVVHGRGLHGLQEPSLPLNCVRSGTTMRLLAGILAGQRFESTLAGDSQLLRRPMHRVAEPLRRMGAEIEDADGRAPLTVHGQQLRGGDHTLAVASAQVKSALLLAGLYADGHTIVRQPGPARDHTERMLAAMGAAIEVDGLIVTLTPNPQPLAPLTLAIPGDISSAAFPLVAATLLPGSEVTVAGVGINPTRTGLLDVLQAMGAEIVLENERTESGEPVADVTVRSSNLVGVEVGGDTVVRMIDEFPVLAVGCRGARPARAGRTVSGNRAPESFFPPGW